MEDLEEENRRLLDVIIPERTGVILVVDHRNEEYGIDLGRVVILLLGENRLRVNERGERAARGVAVVKGVTHIRRVGIRRIRRRSQSIVTKRSNTNSLDRTVTMTVVIMVRWTKGW